MKHKKFIFDIQKIRMEISFKSFDELRSILSFYQENGLNKINIPCKNNLRRDFLLNSIKITREEFSNINIIPHFSILHEFRRNSVNTQIALKEFLSVVQQLGCTEVLLVSGSRKRSTLDTVSTLEYLKDNPIFLRSGFSIGVAFNPYLPDFLFEEEIKRLEQKLQSCLVNSIWIQFGTDTRLFESRMRILQNILLLNKKNNSKGSNVFLFGSILIPSKQFLARFKFRPWRGVYCSNEFLGSIDIANDIVLNILKTYNQFNIIPIIETSVTTESQLMSLKNILDCKS